MKVLILGFYGVGKTTMLRDYPNAVDLTDVSRPSMETLMTYWNDERYEIVMGDPQWTKVFLESGIPFYIVIPDAGRKKEFLENFRKRYVLGLGGGDDKFCDILNRNWDGWLWTYNTWIPSIRVFTLTEKMWLPDVINKIKRDLSYGKNI